MVQTSDADQLSLDLPYDDSPPADVDRDQLLSWLERLRAVYLRGGLGGTVHEVYPSVPPGSRENYLYFTLAPSLNFQRNSEGLWRSALATYSDAATAFVFFPENCDRDVDDYRTALSLHRLALQPNKHTDIWYRISQVMYAEFDSDPRVLIQKFDCDVVKIKAYVQENKRKFPYIGGPKLLNYWLYMLTVFTDVSFSSRHEISIIPDLHICRATHRLGLVDESKVENAQFVASAWKALLDGTDIAPCDLHGPLWRWSRAAFPDLDRL